MKARVPNIGNAEFQAIAQGAKANCPVSKAYAALQISMEATLEGAQNA